MCERTSRGLGSCSTRNLSWRSKGEGLLWCQSAWCCFPQILMERGHSHQRKSYSFWLPWHDNLFTKFIWNNSFQPSTRRQSYGSDRGSAASNLQAYERANNALTSQDKMFGLSSMIGSVIHFEWKGNRKGWSTQDFGITPGQGSSSEIHQQAQKRFQQLREALEISKDDFQRRLYH